MNKTLFLFLMVSILFSCQKKTDTLKQDDSSHINTISVIIDDQLWNSEVGDSIRNKFATPVLGLPQEEPLFTIKQFPVKLFEGFSTGSRNMIIVKKSDKNLFEIKANEFGETQNSIHITGKSTNEILFLLEKHSAEIIKRMRETEIKANQQIITDSLQNTYKIKKKFNIDIAIPIEYEYVRRRKNFIWLKKEITSGNNSIIIYQIPYNSIRDKNAVNDIVKVRDSIGKLYIHAKSNNAKMLTEEAYFPYFSKIRWNEYNVYETKGTWEINSDFMSGPFINYAIKDKANNRILVLEGFCYAPSKQKRDLMFELESIIKTIKIPKTK
ncbi:DUF4837 family protein [Flavobacterium macrobrachii]|uniref:DUF4837 family protein n=1 Tax=Flavobacterium macrobrachii TaxID=591204 RepID=A0ABS2D0Q2_9FLAO|nr:DUF4837 family protein [Flavobacterium macrobrachii]MBM6500792.1 DUF4837 family protein [Flavobacterium macrobrachii]